MDKTESYEDAILGWLRSKGGDVVLVAGLARRFMVGQASMLALLNEMAAAGKIRRSNAKRSLGFYVPSQTMLNAERVAKEEVGERKVLKIDKHRAELYAQIAADRANIRSIG